MVSHNRSTRLGGIVDGFGDDVLGICVDTSCQMLLIAALDMTLRLRRQEI